jgi:two-component sensor histidine kinase
MTLLSSTRLGPPPVLPLDLALEANHRVANHLSMLVALVRRPLAAIEAGPETMPRELVADLLTDMAGKILSVARLHLMLARRPAPGEVELSTVLASVMTELQASGLCADRLHVTTSLEGCHVDATQASMLMMALSEIATNAIKYAHPTGLPVELTIAGAELPGGGLQLQIGDDGVGFPEGFDERRDAGIGLRLVRTLVECAGGNVAIKSDPLGLTFKITLPARPRLQ